MTLKSLRITNERHAGRRLIHINRKRVWVCESCVDMILLLSHSDDYTHDSGLNANPRNVARYAYKWHKDLAKAGAPVKLFETNKNHGWRLTIPPSKIRFETMPGNVPEMGSASTTQGIQM